MGKADLNRVRGAVRRTTNALAELGPALAALDELDQLPDNFSRYTVAKGEELSDADVLAFLRLARGDTRKAIKIVVLGLAEEPLSEVKGQQAADPGETDVRSAAGSAAA